jgi:hypothetical protein
MEGMHGMRGAWMWMAHGFVNAVYDRQSGPRGDRKTFVESMAMLMAQRRVGNGTLGIRTMLSLATSGGRHAYRSCRAGSDNKVRRRNGGRSNPMETRR